MAARLHHSLDKAARDALRGYDKAQRMAEIIATRWKRMAVRLHGGGFYPILHGCFVLHVSTWPSRISMVLGASAQGRVQTADSTPCRNGGAGHA